MSVPVSNHMQQSLFSFRYTLFALVGLFSGFTVQSHAQNSGPLPERTLIFSQNSISNIGAIGDTLWVGPQLVRNIGNSFDWYVADTDSVSQGRGRLYSLALAPDTVLVGLGYITNDGDNSVQTMMGFYLSVDGGDSWNFINPPLDNLGDTKIRYGGQDVPALPIVVPQQAPPYNVTFRGSTLFTAAWALGIRRSTDFGQTWERLLLPPFELDELTPEGTYDFEFNPRTPNASSLMGQKYPKGWTNFLGFSIMIDHEGYVWAGTAGGLNISENALTSPADRIRWRHIRAEGGINGMLGNWIIRIRQNPYDHKVWMTNWITFQGERQGLVTTSNRGLTFEQHLVNEDILDVTFNAGYIFAAGRNGLFISPDNGTTWIKQPQIRSSNSVLKNTTSFQTAAKTTDRIWIGTSDGLISTADNGLTWEITRVDFPMSGGNIYQTDNSETNTFAYPSPFSRTQDGVVRIRFKTTSIGTASIELMDFGMDRIIRLPDVSVSEPGVYEIAWDGLGTNNNRIPNGPVFYTIKIGSERITGKFLILD